MAKNRSLKFTIGILLPFLLLTLFTTFCGQKEDLPAYKNPNLPLEERVEDLLARMTLQEKIDQLSGVGFDTKENKRLGIPVLRMADGPVGVRHGKATAFPAAVGIAAAWNPELTQKIAAVIAKEAKSKGRNYLLGPCVNIHRHPLGGRNFESYGEDPFLAARMAVAFVKGIQGEHIPASIKHFACNNQEWERHRIDVQVDERALREIYLPAFKAAVKEADVWTVMAAYNVLRGEHCSENKYLLKDILKEEWGFTGFVVSDWGSTYSTAKAADAGLDLEMPFGKFFGDKLLKAVQKGEVSEAVIDDKIRRLMRVRFKAGMFEDRETPDDTVVQREEHKQLALEAAGESIVLLKNKNNVLPLEKSKIKTLAVLGPNAHTARTGGGGSSKVTPFYAVSPIEGLKKALGDDVKILYSHGTAMKGDIHPLSPGYMTPSNTSQGTEGLWGEYFAGTKPEGKPVLARCDKRIDFNWGYDSPHPKLHRVDDKNTFSIRWTGYLLPPETGVYHLKLINNDGIRLYVNDKLLIDNWKQNRLKFNSGKIVLTAGKRYKVRIEYFFDGGISIVKFGWNIPGYDTIEEAAKLAKEADAAIVFAGLSNRFESESFDRIRMNLPNQDKLIKAAAAANPNTIVVLETGSTILMNEWIDNVAAVIQAWYPGQEGGNAIADILLGNVNPSGKLPFSIMGKQEHSPAFKDYRDKETLKTNYAEGIFVGYRYLDKHKIEPLFPFGHGLSYTHFEYSDLKIEPLEDDAVVVKVDIRNTGKRSGAEVVQVYVRDVESSLERPEKELKGFQKVVLEPGEKQTVQITLYRDAFSFYHPEKKQWMLEPGEFEILIGSSSKNIRLRERKNVH
jgi:beta-glucosidase